MRCLTIILLALPLPSLADDASRDVAELYPTLPGVEYYCTDATGARREIGDVICIAASCQTWVARCEVSLNTPTWRKVGDGCPGVSLTPYLVDPLARLTSLAQG